MTLALAACSRSEDPFRQVGCCILRHDNTVAATGYNGAISKATISWEDRDKRRARVSHAEASALRYVKPGECKILAVTLQPCVDCIKNIVMYGITEVYYLAPYLDPNNDVNTHTLCEEFNVKLTKFDKNQCERIQNYITSRMTLPFNEL